MTLHRASLLVSQRKPLPVPKAGQYAITAAPFNTGAAQTGTGNLRLFPWLVDGPLSLDRVGAEVTVAGDAGSKFRLGIYADNGYGYPGALVVDAGTINGDSVTVQEIPISLALAPGVYWIGGVTQVVTTTQPTIRTVNAYAAPVMLGTGTTLPAAGQGGCGYVQSGISGALPTSFSTAVSISGSAPRTLIRAA